MNLRLNFIPGVLLCVLSVIQTASAQEITEKQATAPISPHIVDNLTSHASDVSKQLTRRTTRYLQRLAKQENQLKKALSKTDSAAANALFNSAGITYAQLANKLEHPAAIDIKGGSAEYMPYMDSLVGSLRFLDKNKVLLSELPKEQQQLANSLQQVRELQDRLKSAQKIQVFVKARQDQVRQALRRYTTLPAGISGKYAAFRKNVFYCQEEIRQCKKTLNDPDLAARKALQILNHLPAFGAFMQQNSFLSYLFRMPANYGTPAALSGLQTRSQVEQLMAGSLGAGSATAGNMAQQLQSAQSQLNQLKDKINVLGSGSSEMDMPDFKPNPEKTRKWSDRIELGTNFQTTGGNKFFPTTADVGVSAAYKLSAKSSIGLGVSYRIGLGKDIRHMALTSEGVGLRSFFDLKLKGSIWVTAGAEMNYRSRFHDFKLLQDYSAWQKSALIGLSKKYQLSKKAGGNAQVMYDVLWKQQIPRTQPFIFRTGWNFHKP